MKALQKLLLACLILGMVLAPFSQAIKITNRARIQKQSAETSVSSDSSVTLLSFLNATTRGEICYGINELLTSALIDEGDDFLSSSDDYINIGSDYQYVLTLAENIVADLILDETEDPSLDIASLIEINIQYLQTEEDALVSLYESGTNAEKVLLIDIVAIALKAYLISEQGNPSAALTYASAGINATVALFSASTTAAEFVEAQTALLEDIYFDLGCLELTGCELVESLAQDVNNSITSNASLGNVGQNYWELFTATNKFFDALWVINGQNVTFSPSIDPLFVLAFVEEYQVQVASLWDDGNLKEQLLLFENFLLFIAAFQNIDLRQPPVARAGYVLSIQAVRTHFAAAFNSSDDANFLKVQSDVLANVGELIDCSSSSGSGLFSLADNVDQLLGNLLNDILSWPLPLPLPQPQPQLQPQPQPQPQPQSPQNQTPPPQQNQNQTPPPPHKTA